MQLLIALAKTVTNTGTKRTLQCKQLMNKNAIHKTLLQTSLSLEKPSVG